MISKVNLELQRTTYLLLRKRHGEEETLTISKVQRQLLPILFEYRSEVANSGLQKTEFWAQVCLEVSDLTSLGLSFLFWKKIVKRLQGV